MQCAIAKNERRLLHYPQVGDASEWIDRARINEMSHWYLFRPEAECSVIVGEQPSRTVSGQELIAGMAFDVALNGVA